MRPSYPWTAAAALALLAARAAHAEDFELRSPKGQVAIRMAAGDDLTWSVAVGEQIANPLFDDWRSPVVHQGDFGGVDINADDVEPVISETSARYRADISETKNTDAHD